MNTSHRFQIDLTKEELNSIERLGNLTGLRTKKDVILNAITLFQWAAKETLYGRNICSVDERTQAIKQLEIPALSAICDRLAEPLTDAQIRKQRETGGRPFSEFHPSSTGGANVTGNLDTEGRAGMVEGMGTGAEK